VIRGRRGEQGIPGDKASGRQIETLPLVDSKKKSRKKWKRGGEGSSLGTEKEKKEGALKKKLALQFGGREESGLGKIHRSIVIVRKTRKGKKLGREGRNRNVDGEKTTGKRKGISSPLEGRKRDLNAVEDLGWPKRGGKWGGEKERGIGSTVVFLFEVRVGTGKKQKTVA